MSTSEPDLGTRARADRDPADRERERADRQRDRAGRRGQPATTPTGAGSGTPAGNMLPGRGRRRFGLERVLVRLVATGGVVGIGVALGAILAASHVQGWIIGLVIATLSVLLSAVLWSSRQL